MIKVEGAKVTLGYHKDHTDHSDMVSEFAMDLGLIFYSLSESLNDTDFDFILNESSKVFKKLNEGEEIWTTTINQ